MGHLAHAVSVFEYPLHCHTTYTALGYPTLPYSSLPYLSHPPYLILSYAMQCCTVLYYERLPLHYISSHLLEWDLLEAQKIFVE